MTIEIDEETVSVLRKMSDISKLPIGKIVRQWAGLSPVPISPSSFEKRISFMTPGFVEVVGRYKGIEVRGRFDPIGRHLLVESGVPAHLCRRYRSSSEAAMAVIRAINPNRISANTNGKLFWRDQNGRCLKELFLDL
jgi:hypothetical protein